MIQPGRKYSASDAYRYGFNGKENDNEVKGEGNQQDYGMRIYDPRLGKFLSVDPLTRGYPWYTPYQFAGNKPIMAIDLDGAEEKPTITGKEEGQSAETTTTLPPQSEGGRPGYQTKTWYWHKGGLRIGQKINEKTKALDQVLSEPGWLSGEGYLNLLSETDIAKQLSQEVGYGGYIGYIATNAKENLEKFIGIGLNENATAFLDEAARKVGQDSRFYRSGYTPPSSFNVEDLIGIGIIVKQGLKYIGSLAAKNIFNTFAKNLPKNSPQIFIKVGHWCPKESYILMKTTGKVVEEEGGQAFFSISGPGSWGAQAPKGWVYSEFEVAPNSLIQGGQWDWFKAVFPTANKSMQSQVLKQGGELTPRIRNLSEILQTKQ